MVLIQNVLAHHSAVARPKCRKWEKKRLQNKIWNLSNFWQEFWEEKEPLIEGLIFLSIQKKGVTTLYFPATWQPTHKEHFSSFPLATLDRSFCSGDISTAANIYGNVTSHRHRAKHFMSSSHSAGENMVMTLMVNMRKQRPMTVDPHPRSPSQLLAVQRRPFPPNVLPVMTVRQAATQMGTAEEKSMFLPGN